MFITVDAATWDAPWFAELMSDRKLLFLYLLTNGRATPSGAFEITVPDRDALETWFTPEQLTDILSRLPSNIVWRPEL